MVRQILPMGMLYDGIIPEMLDSFEIQVIAEHNTVAPHGSNLTTGGKGGTHSAETGRKMSKSRKGQKTHMYR